jgi:hypothetical protein
MHFSHVHYHSAHHIQFTTKILFKMKLYFLNIQEDGKTKVSQLKNVNYFLDLIFSY